MLCGDFTHFLLCIFVFLLSTFNYLPFSLFPCPSSFFLPSLVSPAFQLCEKAARSLIRVPCNWAVFLILLLKQMGNDCQVWWEEVQLSLCINTTGHRPLQNEHPGHQTLPTPLDLQIRGRMSDNIEDFCGAKSSGIQKETSTWRKHSGINTDCYEVSPV